MRDLLRHHQRAQPPVPKRSFLAPRNPLTTHLLALLGRVDLDAAVVKLQGHRDGLAAAGLGRGSGGRAEQAQQDEGGG